MISDFGRLSLILAIYYWSLIYSEERLKLSNLSLSDGFEVLWNNNMAFKPEKRKGGHFSD